MLSTAKSMPWWLVVVTGVLIVAAGIFLLVAPQAGLAFMTFLLAVGVLGFGSYNLYKAYRYKDSNELFVMYLVHGLLNIVLFLLIVFIAPSHEDPLYIQKMSPLFGVILACWFIIFGLFGIIHARQDSENKTRARVSTLILLIGIVLFVPFVIGMYHILFIAIAVLVIGVVRTLLGIVMKTRMAGVLPAAGQI